MIVLYYKKETGQVTQTITAPSLEMFPPPDEDSYAVMHENNVALPGYISNGEYIQIPPRPGIGHQFNWTTKQWEDPRLLAETVLSALDRVDAVAGKARLRYITSVPGQAETYQKKEEQARAWAASNFSGEPPSFIAAEASALGRDPVAVAQEIIGLADYWVSFKGPEIEACRRKWKVAVESATSVIQVDNLIIQAIAELDSL